MTDIKATPATDEQIAKSMSEHVICPPGECFCADINCDALRAIFARIAADAETITAREAAYDQAQEGLKSARKQESEMRETIRKQADEIERMKGRLSSVPDLVEAWADETRKARDQVRVLREALELVKADRAYQQLSGGRHFTSAPTEQEWKQNSAQRAWSAVDSALAATEPKG